MAVQQQVRASVYLVSSLELDRQVGVGGLELQVLGAEALHLEVRTIEHERQAAERMPADALEAGVGHGVRALVRDADHLRHNEGADAVAVVREVGLVVVERVGERAAAGLQLGDDARRQAVGVVGRAAAAHDADRDASVLDGAASGRQLGMRGQSLARLVGRRQHGCVALVASDADELDACAGELELVCHACQRQRFVGRHARAVVVDVDLDQHLDRGAGELGGFGELVQVLLVVDVDAQALDARRQQCHAPDLARIDHFVGNVDVVEAVVGKDLGLRRLPAPNQPTSQPHKHVRATSRFLRARRRVRAYLEHHDALGSGSEELARQGGALVRLRSRAHAVQYTRAYQTCAPVRLCAYLDHRPPIDVEGARARHDEVDVVLEGVEVDEEGRRVHVGEDVGADGLVSRQRAVRDFGVVVGGPDRDLVRIVLSAAAAAR